MQRYFQQFQKTAAKGIVTLYANVSIGASGAPTLNYTSSPSAPNKSLGIQGISRSSAGLYVVTFGDPSNTALADNYTYLVDFDYSILYDTVSVIGNGQVFADNSASGTVSIQFYGATSSSTTTNVATDPDNGAVLLLRFVLKQGII